MITINHQWCILCRGCSSVCPAGAIKVGETKMKTYPEKCIDCGLCVKACPLKVITLYKGVKEPRETKPETGPLERRNVQGSIEANASIGN